MSPARADFVKALCWRTNEEFIDELIRLAIVECQRALFFPLSPKRKKTLVLLTRYKYWTVAERSTPCIISVAPSSVISLSLKSRQTRDWKLCRWSANVLRTRAQLEKKSKNEGWDYHGISEQLCNIYFSDSIDRPQPPRAKVWTDMLCRSSLQKKKDHRATCVGKLCRNHNWHYLTKVPWIELDTVRPLTFLISWSKSG